MEKKRNIFKEFLNDSKKRHLATLILILPFLIVIIVFGLKIYSEAKSLISGLTGEAPVEVVKPSHTIKNGSFVLRDNATTLQETLFNELKDMYENNASGKYTENDLAVSTVKNYIADFFTWSNKAGQYDVGGNYFIYSPQRQTIYIQVRDQFYQYINQYINKYGSDALLEVESVEASIVGEPFEYLDNEEIAYRAFKVNANWTYVQKNKGFDSSKYDTRASFVVVDNNGRYEIVYMGSKEYTPNEE